MNLLQTIDVIDKIDSKAFNSTYYLRQKPLVIKGLATTEDAGKLWSIRYFKEKMSDMEVGIYDNGNMKSKASAHTKPDLKMKFGDYLTLIETNKPTDLRIFLFNFFKAYPELQKEFPCPGFLKEFLTK